MIFYLAQTRTAQRLSCFLLLCIFFSPLSLLQAAEPQGFSFEKDIRPILRAHCMDCHGATPKLEGELDLRLVRFMKKGGESGPAIDLQKPHESLLLERVEEGEMPPGEHKVPQNEIEIIKTWLSAGAPTLRPEPEKIGPGLGVTIEERSFWSFQPIKRPVVPDNSNFTAQQQKQIRTPIDALVLKAVIEKQKEQIKPEEIVFSPEATRRTIVKRVYFDLIGLPPSPEQMQKWLDDPARNEIWFRKLVEEVLKSPHYGERWARHWLDVAGYADSEGYSTKDVERPWAWKYRDWVIRAFNKDKPFDQFIIEQLAGDELAGPKKGEWTAEQIELLTATGFLRMAADGTGSGANNPEGRNRVMIDTIKIVGTGLLGLSLQCAQCHDHRYDPIPQTDYYAIRAIFEPALDCNAWKVPNARRVSLYTDADRKKAAEIEKEAQVVIKQRSKKQEEFMKQALEIELKKYEEPLRTELRKAYQTPKEKRSEQQKQLFKKYPSLNITPGVLYQYVPDVKKVMKEYETRILKIRAKKPAEQFLRALVEPANHTPKTRLFYRGDFLQPKQEVLPATLTICVPEGTQPQFKVKDEAIASTGRRLAFARSLTNGKHPLFARVMVNRIWMHHFGRALVPTPADFGKLGAAPTNPELLDWLADEFMKSGWSVKKLHHLIMTSTVWRQKSDITPSQQANHSSEFAVLLQNQTALLRKPLIRLEAELIRDRMLATTGQLDQKLYGPPLDIKEDDSGQVVVSGAQTRRSLYIKSRRSRPLAMLQAFDAPVMETNCEIRPSSTVATQSLMLINGNFILDQAAKLADRAISEAHKLPAEYIARLPKIASKGTSIWQYGYGMYDDKTNHIATFQPLTFWTGSQWQAGEKLPDAKLGWVLLNNSGGHPDRADRAVIRRWVAKANGVISIEGTLSNGSANGDGVRGRIVSSRSGKAGQWSINNATVKTTVSGLKVQAGDTIDFVTDCITNHNSDSFNWPVTISLQISETETETFSSKENFRGPLDPPELIAARIIKAWELALCREPTEQELFSAYRFIMQQLNSTMKTAKGKTASQQALTNLCQALMSSNEFLYVD